MFNTGYLRHILAAAFVALLSAQTLAQTGHSVTESNRQLITKAFSK